MKLLAIWTVGKAEAERVREEKQRREKMIHCVFPMICGSGGSKSRLAKAGGAEPSSQIRDEQLHAVVARSIFGSKKCKKLTVSDHILGADISKNWTPLWREAHLQVKTHKAHNARTTFGS